MKVHRKQPSDRSQLILSKVAAINEFESIREVFTEVFPRNLTLRFSRDLQNLEKVAIFAPTITDKWTNLAACDHFKKC